jgi:hypothetical protein
MGPRWVVVVALMTSGCANSHAPIRSELLGPPGEESEPLPDGEGPLLSTLLERRCSADGPSLEVTSIWMIPGKPPHDTYFLNVRIRNPLPAPLWLLYDLHDSIPLWTRAVSLDEAGETPRTYGWHFDGGNRFMDAVRVAAHADVLVRALKYSSYGKEEPLILVLAAEVTVEGRPAIAWIRWEDQPLARGEVNMERLEHDGKNHARQERRWVPLGVEVICASPVDRSAGPGKQRR